MTEFTYHPTDHVAHCNLCRSDPSQWATIATSDRAGFPARSVACRNCGLVFITPRMSAQAYGEFYASGAYRRTVEKVTGKPHDVETMHRSQAGYARAIGDWLKPYLQTAQPKTLLDIGGSNGIVAAELCRRFGMAGTVLEPSVSELAEARQRGLIGIQGSFETWLPGRTYQLVTLLQTVDHLLDIAGSLAKIRTLLAPGGLFAVDIVNVAFLYRGFRRIEPACKIDHCFGLTIETMACFLLRAGFELVATPATSLEGRKVLFLCRAGKVVDALPDRQSVDKFFRLIDEVRCANHGA